MPTGIWSSRWRSGCAHWDLDCEEEEDEEEEEAEEEEENRTALIKSNNPHLAGGEKPSSHGQHWVFHGSRGFVTKDWSMHITTADANGEPLAAAQQHFVVGPPDQDMRAAWRMENTRSTTSWNTQVLQVLEKMLKKIEFHKVSQFLSNADGLVPFSWFCHVLSLVSGGS